jgi:hypothetical protein
VNTILDTGPGAWEKQATKSNRKPNKTVQVVNAAPSITHMGLVELMDRNIL